jgi:riboflavin transporter FmnP
VGIDTTIPTGPTKSIIIAAVFAIGTVLLPVESVHTIWITPIAYVPSGTIKEEEVDMAVLNNTHVLPLFTEYFHVPDNILAVIDTTFPLFTDVVDVGKMTDEGVPSTTVTYRI